MIKVFLPKILQYPIIPPLYPQYGQGETGMLFMEGVFKDFTEPIVRVVENIDEAEAIMLPHQYFKLVNKGEGKYISDAYSMSCERGVPLIIYAYGDKALEINYPNAVILRSSQYKSKKALNEIIIPGNAVDLSVGREISFRRKEAVPAVGFCGWADYANFYRKVKAVISDLFVNVRRHVRRDKIILAERNGVLLRKELIGRLRKNNSIETNFIIRSSFSRHKNTIQLDPEIARKEFIDNIVNSDLSLAIRGDGNFSVRLYEILSLGRIPLIIDTDMSLPLEDEIDYASFSLRISIKDIDILERKIIDFWSNLNQDNYLEMQKLARDHFEKRLALYPFLKDLFKSRQSLLRNVKFLSLV